MNTHRRHGNTFAHHTTGDTNGTGSHALNEIGNLVGLTPIKSVRLGNFAMKVLFIRPILSS